MGKIGMVRPSVIAKLAALAAVSALPALPAQAEVWDTSYASSNANNGTFVSGALTFSEGASSPYNSALQMSAQGFYLATPSGTFTNADILNLQINAAQIAQF